MLTLNRLSQREARDAGPHVTGALRYRPRCSIRSSSVPTRAAVRRRADKSLLESQQLRRTGDEYVLDHRRKPLAIPDHLADFTDGARRPSGSGARKSCRSRRDRPRILL